MRQKVLVVTAAAGLFGLSGLAHASPAVLAAAPDAAAWQIEYVAAGGPVCRNGTRLTYAQDASGRVRARCSQPSGMSGSPFHVRRGSNTAGNSYR
jgi:hypothetical protein